ncbi:MAG TPA: alpha/beta fold hydrolase [Rubrobacteraceae bacterium]|nr:alpha/beta fold hydrolase [Rubrobacteraceae bacterium]
MSPMMQIPAHPEAATIEQFAAQPLAYQTIEGVPDFLASRAAGWVEFGARPDHLLSALRKVPDAPMSPDWVGHFSEIAERYLNAARTADRKGEAHRSKQAYLDSAFYFFLARWPYPISPQAREAYECHIRAYLNAARFSELPLEVVSVPFEEAELVGYLRVPTTEGTSPPVVLLSGGIDVWKSDVEIHGIVQTLVERGLAVMTMDAPGTGQSPIRAGTTGEHTYAAMIDYLRERTDVDGERIGFYGLSFGGYWAVKLALNNPRLVAVVNLGGPVHHAFQPDWVSKLPIGTLVNLAATMGVNFQEAGIDGLTRRLAEMSLLTQGHFSFPSRPALLSVNGARDEVVPIADLELLGEQGIEQDSLVFAQDRHVASYNFGLHLPFSAAWLADKLKL